MINAHKIFFTKIILIGLGCIVSFLILEVYSKICLDVSPYLWTPDIKLGYRSAPNALGRYYGFPIKINPKGIRDYECTYGKKNGIFRVVLLGDSFTIDAGIKNMVNIYPKIVERHLLNKSYPVEIINLVVAGYNTTQEIKWFKTERIKYEPDLVILGFILNDNEPPAINMALQNG